MKTKTEAKLMMRDDNLKMLSEASPRAVHRMMGIINETYNKDIYTIDDFDQWWRYVEHREIRRFPSRAQMQVIGNLNQLRMLMRCHFEYRIK